MRRAACALVVALFLAGCGPKEGPSRHFFGIFHNNSNFPQAVKVRTAVDGIYRPAVVSAIVPPHTAKTFVLDPPPVPDRSGSAPVFLVEFEAGWGRVSYSGPETSDTSVLNVSFPDGASWKGYP